MKKEEIKETNEVLENAAQVIEELEAANAIKGPPPLQVEDLFSKIKSQLSEKALKSIENKVTQLMKLNPDGSVEYKVRFFGIQCSTKEVGQKKLAEMINDIAQQYTIKGALAAAIMLPLSNGYAAEETYAFLTYLAFSADDAVKMEERQWRITEGEMPETYLETMEDIAEKLATPKETEAVNEES